MKPDSKIWCVYFRGHTENMLEGFYIPSGLGAPWDSPGKSAEVAERPLGYLASHAASEILTQIKGR